VNHSTYFIFILVVALSMKGLFRGLAAAFKKAAPAQAVAGVLLLGLSLYTGYQIPKPSMIGALRWISYINVSFGILLTNLEPHECTNKPIRYAFEGIMTNEFHTLDGVCSTLVPSGPGYEGISLNNQVCTVLGSEPGQATVSGSAYLALSFSYYFDNLWRVCVLATFFFVPPPLTKYHRTLESSPLLAYSSFYAF
jgi:ATP-binding cassette, subfamily G (WHITE), member 2, SNQ2